MPVNSSLADKQWSRYTFARDNGHTDFVEKAHACDNNFRGNQWKQEDKDALNAVKRPALTINKILPTVLNVAGEQIANRADIAFRPRGMANEGVSDALNKVFKQVSDANQLDWLRSEMFMDGTITSRGFLDIRMDFSDNVAGDIRMNLLNPKNVLPDPDACEYDPDKWGDVIVSKWLTADDIAVLYNEGDAEILRNRDTDRYTYGYDAVDSARDRFGTSDLPLWRDDTDVSNVSRDIRVLDRQYRVLDRPEFFVDRWTGEMRQVPLEWKRDQIAFFLEKNQPRYTTTKKLVRRIRWTVVADDVILHDDWSPYKHFTVVPYFPVFRHGHTIGTVENLLSPQEQLNKVSSQELHVVNTTANSGYKVKAGNLTGMTVEELEQKGAQTGVVIEVNEMDGLEKLTPNQVPQGLDRVSYKSEEAIKSISGVNDAMQGFSREDVAAKAIEKNKQAGSTGLAKSFDNLKRTDLIIGRNTVDLIQEFYTDQRIITITKDHVTGESESIMVNEIDPATEEIKNDLTLGEYDVIVTSVPHRETLEDSEFEQLLSLRIEAGVQIPDTALIGASRVRNKQELLRGMEEAQNSPEAQQAKQLQMAGAQADVEKTSAETEQKRADAQLKLAKAGETGVKTQKEAATPIEGPEASDPTEQAKNVNDIQIQREQFEHEKQMDLLEANRKREKDQTDAQLKSQDMEQKRRQAVVQQAQQAAREAQNPKPQPTT